MALARREAGGDQLLGAVEEDEAHVVASVHQNVAIGALERGAGDDGVLALARRAISAAMAFSQGQRSSSVRGWPALILATLLAGWNLSPSSTAPAEPLAPALRRPCSCPSRTRPSRSAHKVGLSSATNSLRKRGLIDQPDRFAIRSARVRPAGSRLRRRVKIGACRARDLEQHLAAGGERRQRQGDARARTARHWPWGRRRPSARFPRARDRRETARRYGRPGRAPIRTRSNSGRAGSRRPRRRMPSTRAHRASAALVRIGDVGRDRVDVGLRARNDRERSRAPPPCC